jgi:hypothetical protein
VEDFAPAPTQHISDERGQIREESLAARRKAVKRVPRVQARRQEVETEPEPEPQTDHLLDVLA